MKINTELRRIIESRFAPHNLRRVRDSEFPALLKAAAKNKPELQKILTSLEDARRTVKQAETRLKPMGLCVYDDGEVHLDDEDKFAKLVKLPPVPVTRGEVLHKLAALTPKEGVSYLKTLGIDWS